MASTDLLSAIKTLNDDPTIEQVTSCLSALRSQSSSFSIPNPQATRIYVALLTKTLPDFWDIISRDENLSTTRDDIVIIFRSVAGIGSLSSRLRLSSNNAKVSEESAYHLSLLLNLLELVIEPDTASSLIWKNIVASTSSSDVKRTLVWKEYTKVIASGVIISTVAEAEDQFKKLKTIRESSWISNGPAFAEWLGRNIAVMVKELGGKIDESDEKELQALMQLFSKSLSFSYRGM